MDRRSLGEVDVKPITRIASLALVLGVAACGTPTPYQPAVDGKGYAEQPLETNRYRVTFSGNSLTSRETVENYLLYRAAEVTLASGNDYFLVVERDTERSTTYHTTFTGFGGHPGFHSFRNFNSHSFGGFSTATARPRDRYQSFANIVVGQGEKPADEPDAYDARDVLKRLAQTIERNPVP